MLKNINKKIRLPKNRVSSCNYEVLSAEEMNPKFNYRKAVSDRNEHMPVFAVRFDHNDTGYVAYMSDCSGNDKGRDCHTALYTEADYLLDDIPKPVWEKIEQEGKTVVRGKLPEGIEPFFDEALRMGNDTVLETLGKHTQSYENIDMKIKYGIDDDYPDQLPYFSVTCMGYDSYGRNVIGGADDKNILRACPELKNLCHMHLRDIEGAPMYPVENGWYYVSDEKLHDGFNEGNRRSTVAKYLDIPQDFANRIVDSYQAGRLTKADFVGIVEMQRPTWKLQADAVIREYGLTIRKDRPHTRDEVALAKAAEKARNGRLKSNGRASVPQDKGMSM